MKQGAADAIALYTAYMTALVEPGLLTHHEAAMSLTGLGTRVRAPDDAAAKQRNYRRMVLLGAVQALMACDDVPVEAPADAP